MIRHNDAFDDDYRSPATRSDVEPERDHPPPVESTTTTPLTETEPETESGGH